jgi:hypothetical protein
MSVQKDNSMWICKRNFGFKLECFGKCDCMLQIGKSVCSNCGRCKTNNSAPVGTAC